MQEPTVLLIEDNPDDIALARRAITRRKVGARLEVATSGREAVEMLHRPDHGLPRAVFLDVNMPEWNGFEVLRRLRAEDRTRLLPVVMLTTSSEPGDIALGYRLGANSYVAKPLDFEEFTEIFAAMTRYWTRVNEVS
ncbi:MAG TPA: response regulator [Bryobacteraceae bacterium]|nr:response regulator [Bryobacteraceae bacterium]